MQPLAGSDRGRFDHEQGWAAIPHLLSDDEVAAARSVCAELLRLPPTERRAGDKPAAGTHHLNELDDRSDLIRSLVERPLLTELVSTILGPRFDRCQVSYRSPQPSFGAQKLHADDLPKQAIGPDTIATAIVALTPFTADNGATRVVPGSHRRPDLQRRSGNLDHHPDEIVLTGHAGTAFVFSGHLLHSGTRNRSGSERPALQLLWRR